MKKPSSQLTGPTKLLAVAAVVFSVCSFVGTTQGAEPAFDGEVYDSARRLRKIKYVSFLCFLLFRRLSAPFLAA